MNGLRRDVLRLALLVVLWTAYVVLPTPIGAQHEGEADCEDPKGCMGGAAPTIPTMLVVKRRGDGPTSSGTVVKMGMGVVLSAARFASSLDA